MIQSRLIQNTFNSIKDYRTFLGLQLCHRDNSFNSIKDYLRGWSISQKVLAPNFQFH